MISLEGHFDLSKLFFMSGGGKTATRTYEERKRIQAMWENGAGVKEIGEAIKAPASSIYAELRRGKAGERLPDQRPRYDADLAQLRFRESIERRGNRGPRQPTHLE